VCQGQILDAFSHLRYLSSVNSSRHKVHRFLAAIYKVGINRAVDVPEEICRELCASGYVPVVATVSGQSGSTTLIPAGGGAYRLYLDSRLRKAARVDAGDVVSVMLELDGESREVPVPAELRRALRKSASDRKIFVELTPGLRREFLCWVMAAKTAETRERRVQRGLQTLRDRAAASRSAGVRRKL
jgi:hypothetical protein